MYVEDFNAFYQQAEELLLKDPIKTRYAVKYRHTEGKLVLKVTDDVVVSRCFSWRPRLGMMLVHQTVKRAAASHCG
jgi:signal recognition particle subunit SRP9